MQYNIIYLHVKIYFPTAVVMLPVSPGLSLHAAPIVSIVELKLARSRSLKPSLNVSDSALRFSTLSMTDMFAAIKPSHKGI